MGLNNNISKSIFLNNYESLNDINIGVLQVEQEIKTKATRHHEELTTTKFNNDVHEDGTTKMYKPDKKQDNCPKFDFSVIPVCGIGDAESTSTLFEDGVATYMTIEPLMEYTLQASDKDASKDDASIFGCKRAMIEHGLFPWNMEASDDVPSPSFIHGDDSEMVEHGFSLAGIWI
ncbi:gag-pol polyprotein [Hordeum vulgare]|nr:gag-pol polyprotein [Hordeum vulgare]